jgi:hypothetical protein
MRIPAALALCLASATICFTADITPPRRAPALDQAGFPAFISRPEMAARLTDKAMRQMERAHALCPTARFQILPGATMEEKPEMAANGEPQAGLWSQHVRFSGCGRELVQHIYLIKFPRHGLVTAEGVPGDTALGFRRQQHQIGFLATTLPARLGVSCQHMAVRDSQQTAAPVLRDAAQHWPLHPSARLVGSETWLIDLCGQRVDVAIQSFADAAGQVRDVAILPAPHRSQQKQVQASLQP